MPHLDTLDLDARPQAVDHALAWLRTLAARDAWAPRTHQGLMLALDEAITNALMHGLHDRPGAHLRVEHRALPGQVDITLEDDGPAFDPTRAPDPPPVLDLDSLEIGGRGILLMRQTLSGLHYERRDDRNRLTLSMRTPDAT